MKKIAILALSLVVVSAAFAGPGESPLPSRSLAFTKPQAPAGGGAWSFNLVFDFKSRKFDAVAINDLSELTHKGKPTGFTLAAFAGTTTDSEGKAVGGIGISHHRALFDQVYAQSFAGFKLEVGVPVSIVAGIGLSYRF